MSASTAVLANVGSDLWNAEMYESLSVASRLSSMLKDRTQIFVLGYHLRRLNNRLDTLFSEMYDLIEGKKPVPPSEPLTPERVRNTVNSVWQLHGILLTVVNAAKSRRLTNYSLLSNQVRRLERLEEATEELAEWLEMALLKKDEVNAIFDRARAEKAKGEVYDLSGVK